MLSGISLGGTEFCYNNPLNVSDKLPFKQRWGNEREGYIAWSNCCAPNVTRALAQVSNYAYNLADDGLYVNLYGSNHLVTKTIDGDKIEVAQQTNYPWDGKVTLKIVKAPKKPFSVYLRIPGWSEGTTITVNNEKIDDEVVSASYSKISRKWKKGDVIELNIPMPVQLMQGNPLVEEVKNQVAVKRGPVVYCLETDDLSKKVDINTIVLDIDSEFTMNNINISNRNLVGIKTQAFVEKTNWEKALYKPITKDKEQLEINLVPYFSWGNRTKGEMTVWLAY